MFMLFGCCDSGTLTVINIWVPDFAHYLSPFFFFFLNNYIIPLVCLTVDMVLLHANIQFAHCVMKEVK